MAYLINGERVEDEVFADEFETIKEHYQSLGQVVCCDRDKEFWGYARENVINRTVLEQASIRRFGDISDEEVDARFEALKAEHGGESEFYDNTGFNAGDQGMIKRRLRSSMIIDRLIEAELGEPAAPAPEEIAEYYERNLDRYLTKEEVRVSQIFIEPSSHDAAREAYVLLRELREQLVDGEIDFDEAAREHGSDPERDVDLGFMRQGETMPEIESITFSMRIGEVSPVIATHYGFHLFKVTEQKPPEPIPQEEIPGLAEQCATELRNAAVAGLIERIKTESEIEELSSTEA